MVRRLALLLGGLALLYTPTAGGQEAAFGQLYGLGVHAYFSQEYASAYEHLTKAIDAGSQDPRTCYFRGLCYLQLGREDEAKMDFEKGAELEAAEGATDYQVARALERIQGEDRMLLEEYRRDARATVLERDMQRRRQMYGEMRAEQSAILERQIEQAPAVPAGAPAPAAGSNDDPFGVGDAAAPAAQEPPAAAEPAAPSNDNPFGQPAASSPMEAAPEAPAEPAANDDPFATPAAPAPAEEPAKEEPAAPAPAAADPFGAPAPAEPAPAPAAEPAMEEPAAPAADPFGAPAPAEPAPAPAAEPAMEEPAAPAADPFGAPRTS